MHLGYWGSCTYKELSKLGYKILKPKSKQLDLDKYINLKKFFLKNKIFAVIHLAWKVYPMNQKNKHEIHKYNYNMSKNLISISKLNGVKYFLNISSSNAYLNNKTKISENLLKKKQKIISSDNLDLAKRKVINLIINTNNNKFSYKNLILPHLYGAHHNTPLLLMDKIYYQLKKKSQLKIIINPNQKIDMLHIKDAVSSIIFFLKKTINGQMKDTSINISSGKTKKISKIFLEIEKQTKKKIHYLENKKIPLTKKFLSPKLSRKYRWYPKIKKLNFNYLKN